MLTVEFTNTSRRHGAEVADYNVRVLVNGVCVHRDKVLAHKRADGWRVLVRRFGNMTGTMLHPRRRYRQYTPCAGTGQQAVPGALGIGFQCPSCGLSTIPHRGGTVRRHIPLPAEGS